MMIVCVLSITSCSSKLVYNNLDWLASWYIDDFVTLSDVQEDEFYPAIERFLNWHRKSELQRYIVQIKHIKSDINKGIKADDINHHIEVFKGFWQSALVQVEPSIIKLAYTLDEEQVAELLDEMEERNIERIEDFNDETYEERKAERLDKIENRIESYIGDLTDAQRQLLKSANDSSVSVFSEWMAYRRAWTNSIRKAYTLHDNKWVFKQAISHSILEADSYRSVEYWQKIQDNQKIWVTALTQLLDSLNTKQLQKLNTKLDDYIEDFEDLI